MIHQNKLDIVITQYNESFEIIKPMLDSIELQQGINFNDIKVFIVNIGGKAIRLIKEYTKLYHFKIEYHYFDGKGNISATRQKGFELGKAPYVMFCDCDDMFYNMFGIHTILFHTEDENENGTKGFDVLYSNFYEQHEDLRVYDREKDLVCVHGKVFRRQHLIDNNIKWNDKLIYHEDSYFCRLAMHLSKTTKYVPRGFYLWKHHKGSITRTSDEWLAKTYLMMIDSNDALVSEFIKRNEMTYASWYAQLMIYEGFMFFNSTYANQEICKPFIDSDLRRYKDFYNKYSDIAKQLVESEKKRMYGELAKNVVFANNKTIEEWLKEIYENDK